MMFCPWCDGGWAIGRTLLSGLLFLFLLAVLLALLGLIVSFAFYSASGFTDVVSFLAGVVYGVIIEFATRKVDGQV